MAIQDRSKDMKINVGSVMLTLTPRHMVVLAMAAAVPAAIALAIPAWLAEHHSLIRLLHWWLVFVQGDDSWKPMKVAYDWHAAGHAQTIYQHVLFDEQIKFQYPPSSLFIFVIPHALGIPVTIAGLNMVGWVSVPIVGAATAALAWQATRDWPETYLRAGAAVLAFGLAMTFYPVMWGYKEGQIQLWFSAWFAVSALCFFTGRMRLAGFLIGAICLAKPQFVLFLVWALLRRQWSFAGSMAAVLGIGFAASLYVFGWANHVDYLSALSFMSEHGESFVRNYSVNGVMHRLIGNGYALAFVPRWYAPYHPLVYWTTVASSVAFIGLALWYRRRATPNAIDFSIAALSFTMASPIAWEHHYGVLPPMFLLLAVTLARPGRHNIVAAVALFLAFAVCDVILPPIKSLASGPESLLQATVFFGALTVLVLLYRWRDDCPVFRSMKSSQTQEHALAIKDVAEKPANQRIGEGAQK